MIKIAPPNLEEYLEHIRGLFREYAASLGFKELEPYCYSPIEGAKLGVRQIYW